MTPDELQALDRMLAERVMKWRLDQSGCYWTDDGHYSVIPTFDKHHWDATIDNADFDVREWSRHDATILRKIADMLDRELDAWLKRWTEANPSPVVLPTEGTKDLP